MQKPKYNEFQKFASIYGACQEARQWAQDNGITTVAQALRKCPRLDWLEWALSIREIFTRNVRAKLVDKVLGIYGEENLPKDPKVHTLLKGCRKYIKSGRKPGQKFIDESGVLADELFGKYGSGTKKALTARLVVGIYDALAESDSDALIDLSTGIKAMKQKGLDAIRKAITRDLIKSISNKIKKYEPPTTFSF